MFPVNRISANMTEVKMKKIKQVNLSQRETEYVKIKSTREGKRNRGHTKPPINDFKDHIFKVKSLYLELCVSVNSIAFK